jgi:AcrR family transcriptional regulator
VAHRPSREWKPPGTSSEPPLPRTVELLWSTQRLPRRGPRPALSLSGITEAAIHVADAEGLTAVSMARIAERLGFTTMSLYRYVAGKDEVLALMSDAGIGPPPPTFRRRGDQGWRPAMERYCLAQVDVLMARRWLTELALFTLPVGPNRLAWIDRGLDLLEETPLEAAVRFQILGLLSQHILGEARLKIEMERLAQTMARAEGASPEEVEAAVDPFGSWDPVLRRVADPERFPSIWRAVTEGGLTQGQPDESSQETALFGIRTMLDGVDALIARHAPPRRRPSRP